MPALMSGRRRERAPGLGRGLAAAPGRVASSRRRPSGSTSSWRSSRDELRRRVGGTFTLAELAAAYADAERWVRAVVADRAPVPSWPRFLSVVQDAAFHLYARGAIDYEP